MALGSLIGSAGSASGNSTPDATVTVTATETVTDSASPEDLESAEPAEATSEPAQPAVPEKVEPLPFNASGFLGGTAEPSYAAGEPGEVSVVHVGLLDKNGSGSAVLYSAFRNNTPEGISHVDWNATARSNDSIVATGSSQGTIPDQVQPGGVGLSYIYFENGEVIPDDAEYEFGVETSPTDPTSYNTAPLTVTEATLSGESIVGGATNGTGFTTDGPFSVSIYCFEGDNIVGSTSSFTEQDGPIDDGGTVTFTVRLHEDVCETYAVGVGGYFV